MYCVFWRDLSNAHSNDWHRNMKWKYNKTCTLLFYVALTHVAFTHIPFYSGLMQSHVIKFQCQHLLPLFVIVIWIFVAVFANVLFRYIFAIWCLFFFTCLLWLFMSSVAAKWNLNHIFTSDDLSKSYKWQCLKKRLYITTNHQHQHNQPPPNVNVCKRPKNPRKHESK